MAVQPCVSYFVNQFQQTIGCYRGIVGGLDDKAHDLLPMFLGLNTANPGLCVRDFSLL